MAKYDGDMTCHYYHESLDLPPSTFMTALTLLVNIEASSSIKKVPYYNEKASLTRIRLNASNTH